MFFYPHSIFTKSITNFLDKKLDNSSYTILDVPCGQGLTSYIFSQNKNVKVFAADIDKSSIKAAKEKFKKPNLKFFEDDILSFLNKYKEVQVISIINSLFLLPSPQKVLNTCRTTLTKKGILFVIVPNIEGENYKRFLSDKSNHTINGLELNHEEFESFFEKEGFEIIAVKPICYAPYFNRGIVDKIPFFRDRYLQMESNLKKYLGFSKPNYFEIALKKKS